MQTHKHSSKAYERAIALMACREGGGRGKGNAPYLFGPLGANLSLRFGGLATLASGDEPSLALLVHFRARSDAVYGSA